MEDEQRLEEYLETLWSLREEGRQGLADIREALGESEASHLLLSLMENRWVRVEGERFEFEPDGESRAAQIVRRHRLAERLLHDKGDAIHPYFSGSRTSRLIE